MRAACCLCLPSSAALPSDFFLLSHFTESLSLSRPPPSLFPRGCGGEGGGEQQDPGSSFRSFVLCPMDVSVFSVPTSLPPTFRGSLSAASFRPRRLRLHVAFIHSSPTELMAYYNPGAQSQPRLSVELRSRRAVESNGAYCESHFQRRAFRRPDDVAAVASRIHNSI